MKNPNKLEHEIILEVLEAPIVIFSSQLTDVRSLLTWLENNKFDFKEIRMGMGSETSRDYFHRLRDITHWPYLPQIFINGKFIGGIDELIEHPLLQEGTFHNELQ